MGRRRCNGWGAVRQRLPVGSVADLLPGDDGQGGVDGVEHPGALPRAQRLLGSCWQGGWWPRVTARTSPLPSFHHRTVTFSPTIRRWWSRVQRHGAPEPVPQPAHDAPDPRAAAVGTPQHRRRYLRGAGSSSPSPPYRWRTRPPAERGSARTSPSGRRASSSPSNRSGGATRTVQPMIAHQAKTPTPPFRAGPSTSDTWILPQAGTSSGGWDGKNNPVGLRRRGRAAADRSPCKATQRGPDVAVRMAIAAEGWRNSHGLLHSRIGPLLRAGQGGGAGGPACAGCAARAGCQSWPLPSVDPTASAGTAPAAATAEDCSACCWEAVRMGGPDGSRRDGRRSRGLGRGLGPSLGGGVRSRPPSSGRRPRPGPQRPPWLRRTGVRWSRWPR